MEQTIRKVYGLEKRCMELQRRENELKQGLSQAKYDHRLAKTAVLEYKGSVKSLLDRFRGNRETTEEKLNTAVRHTKAQLDQTERELASVSRSFCEAKAALAALPCPDDLPSSPEKHRLEAELCLEVLPELLEGCEQALYVSRQMDTAARTGQVISAEKRQAAATAPITAGMECKKWLVRLKTALDGLAIPFSLPPFFQAPDGYLSYATQYTRQDRRNEAIDQVKSLHRQLPELKQLIQA